MSSCLQFCVLQLNLGELPLGTTEMYAVKPIFGPGIVVLPCLWRAELDLLWSGINPTTSGLFVLPAAQAYYWRFTPTTPQQCATANVQVYNLTTYDVPPMRLLLVPYGPLPLSDTSKGVYEIPFDGPDPYTKDFQVKYPAGTQFAHLMSDMYGYYGYSGSATVAPNPNNDSPCWDSPKLPFTFSIYPNRLAQCEETRIYWNPSEVQGNPKFLSVIVTVDGEYRPIYTGGLDDVPGYGRGFIWQPPIRAGATVVIVAGDMRGNATGGALAMKVGAGMAFTTTSNSYWTGQCPPPNGIGITYPAVGNNHSNTGSFFNAGTAIGAALGVVSVLVAVAVVLFIRRRRRQRQDIAPIITSPMVTEKNRDARDVQGQELPWGLDRQPAFYLPKPMSSPNPMKQAQLEPRAGLLLHYHPEPFQDTRTMVLDGSSTGQDEVMTQPSIPSDIYTGMGMRADRPWSGNWQRYG